MAEYTRISLRQARESTAAAMKAVEEALSHLEAHGASSLTTTLAASLSNLQEVANSLQLADEHITRKAGLLPAQTPGRPPAE
jgi:hypothetical protein